MITLQRLGWIVAAAIAGIVVASGFQGANDKIASVDLSTLVETSDLGKANLATLEKMKNTRLDLLKFIDDNRVLTVEQANNLRKLWLKENPASVDTASLESLKADIVAQAKKNVELGQKPNLTPEERTLLQEYSSRSASMETLTQQWYQDFSAEVRQNAQDRQVDCLTKAKAAAQSVAKSQSYTLVFDASVAVYAANDLTADALKAMNAKK